MCYIDDAPFEGRPTHCPLLILRAVWLPQEESHWAQDYLMQSCTRVTHCERIEMTTRERCFGLRGFSSDRTEHVSRSVLCLYGWLHKGTVGLTRAEGTASRKISGPQVLYHVRENDGLGLLMSWRSTTRRWGLCGQDQGDVCHEQATVALKSGSRGTVTAGIATLAARQESKMQMIEGVARCALD